MPRNDDWNENEFESENEDEDENAWNNRRPRISKFDRTLESTVDERFSRSFRYERGTLFGGDERDRIRVAKLIRDHLLRGVQNTKNVQELAYCARALGVVLKTCYAGCVYILHRFSALENKRYSVYERIYSLWTISSTFARVAHDVIEALIVKLRPYVHRYHRAIFRLNMYDFQDTRFLDRLGPKLDRTYLTAIQQGVRDARNPERTHGSAARMIVLTARSLRKHRAGDFGNAKNETSANGFENTRQSETKNKNVRANANTELVREFNALTTAVWVAVTGMIVLASERGWLPPRISKRLIRESQRLRKYHKIRAWSSKTRAKLHSATRHMINQRNFKPYRTTRASRRRAA